MALIDIERYRATREPDYVLVVDDDKEQANAITDYLMDEGIPAKAACTTFETIAAVQRQRPRLVLMDINMPEGGGIALVRRLRDMGLDMRIMMMSGHLDAIRRAHAARMDVFAVLDKPIDMTLLIRFVRQYLGLNPGKAMAHPASGS